MRIISGCSTIEDCIRRYGTDARTCFVFPSRIASRLWLCRALALTGLTAVPAELFTSWDAFKIDCCISQAENKNPVSQIIRLLFAHHIAAVNTTAAKPLLQNIIPADYAADGAIFAQWIAGILPQLDHWEKRAAQHKTGKDAEFSDLQILKKAYTEFLETHRLFEPSWAGAEFIPQVRQYILLYPELMEDFDEYRGLLEERPELSVLPAPAFNAGTTPLIQFGTMREEIRSTVLAVEQLLASGVPADDIALSIAGIEEVVPYLKREFALRNIPAEFRLGFKLGEQQAGLLFTLLEQCVQEHYSFGSLKPLLLNPHIPWKHPQQIQAVINFGIKNNCLVSWKDGEHYKNIWKEAFKLPIPYNPHSSVEAEQAEKEQAKDWLLPFMKAAERLVQAKTFSEVQRQYILFRTQYLNIDGFSFEDNAVIGRCVTLMQELTQLEQDFADCLPAQPYRFFTAQLAREIYVPQNTGRAVSIFPFRVAAATPFAHHFVLNCNQKASRVIYQKLPFLRKDKRDALGVVEKDATQAFFAVYAEYGAVRFSASEQTFSGFTVSNGIFTAFAPRPDLNDSDSLLQEYRFFKREEPAPEALYSVQKAGFEQFAGIKQERGFSFLTEPFNGSLPVLSEKLKTGHYTDGAFRISQSGLHLFSGCPAQWFLSSALSIDEEDTDAELFNPRYIGIICHRILERLYQRIRETDRVFISAHLADYRTWAESIFNETVHSQTDFRGPLAAPFIESIKKRSLKSVDFVLTFDAEKLDGYAPYLMEGELQHRNGDILYHGLVDRIAYQEAEGRAVIIDYKTGKVPSATDYTSEAMRDFQMPMYIFLAENRLKQKVLHAFFLGITKEERRYIVNDKEVIPQDSSRSSKTREEFEPSIQAFLQIAQEYAQQVGMEDFRKPAAVQWQDCMGCPFHTICRTTFAVGE
ncbi:PD-(D/E)XK nuclease family protein [Treponema vincentii]|uniref:PD-(D/E)XK nuclease family protein n=1 Tax=Treponema vincentii TaxID=69710 RepID=UPI003D9418A3